MMSKALIPITLAILVCVSAQTDEDTTTTSTTTVSSTTAASTTAASTTVSPTSSPSTNASSSTTSNSTSTSTESSSTSTTAAPTATTPTINSCQRPGRYPATSEKCTQEYIVCIPNFKGGFWQHKWKCAGSLVYNDRFKKCTTAWKADCNTTTSS